jgi:two-component system sensor histidine kinase PilS (NtrC family)
MKTRPRRLRGYLLARSLVLFALIFLLTLYLSRSGGITHPSYWGFFVLAALSFTSTLFSAFGLKIGFDESKIARAQPPLDILCVTVLVYLSGGWPSPLVFFYEFVIIGAAATLFMKGALVAATMSTLTYGTLTALQFHGLVEPTNPFPMIAGAESNVTLRLGLHILAFYAVAFLSSALAEEVKRTGIRLEAAEDEIQDLEHLQASI